MVGYLVHMIGTGLAEMEDPGAAASFRSGLVAGGPAACDRTAPAACVVGVVR